MDRTLKDVGEFTRLMRMIFKVYLMCICLVLGLIGNTLTLIILLQKKMRRLSANQYLTFLTLFDSIYLITCFLNNINVIIPVIENYNAPVYIKLVSIPLCDLTANTSVYLIISFTVERYVACVYPLTSLYLLRPSRSRIVIMFTILLSLVLTAPTFLETKVDYFQEEVLIRNVYVNVSRAALNRSGIYGDYTEEYERYYKIFSSLFFQIIPLFVLVVLNSIIMSKYLRVKKEKLIIQSSSVTNFNNNNSIISLYNNAKNKRASLVNTVNSQQEQPLLNRVSLTGESGHPQSQQNDQQKNLLTSNNLQNSRTSINMDQEIKMRRANAAHLENEQQKATILLVVTVVVFVICQLPSATLLIIETFTDDKEYRDQDILLGFNNIANGFVVINASINFLLYCCFSRSFREVFKELFLNQKQANRRETSTTTTVRSRYQSKKYIT